MFLNKILMNNHNDFCKNNQIKTYPYIYKITNTKIYLYISLYIIYHTKS